MNELSLSVKQQIDFKELQRISEAMFKSGFFKDVRDVSQAIVKVQAGHELGLPPFASMSGIYIVQGKAVLGANIIATLIANDPRYDYRVQVADDTECTIKFYEYGEEVGTASFTIAEAQKAGLTTKDNWRRYPSDMLFARAISRGARRYAPGIFGGAPVYTVDEVNADVTEDGHVEENYYPIEVGHNGANGSATNGNGANGHSNGTTRSTDLTPDEQQVFAKASHFLPTALHTITRFKNDDEVKKALRELGYDKLPGGSDEGSSRVTMYRQLMDYAALRDAGLSQQLAVDVVNEVITEEEAYERAAAPAEEE